MKITNLSYFVAVFMVTTEATRGRPLRPVYSDTTQLDVELS